MNAARPAGVSSWKKARIARSLELGRIASLVQAASIRGNAPLFTPLFGWQSQQLGRLDGQYCRNPNHNVEPDRRLAGLNPRHIAPVNVGFPGQSLLREPFGLSQPDNIGSENPAKIHARQETHTRLFATRLLATRF
jgi:hypothetical protein